MVYLGILFLLHGINLQLPVRHKQGSLSTILQSGRGHKLSTGFPPPSLPPHSLKKGEKKDLPVAGEKEV